MIRLRSFTNTCFTTNYNELVYLNLAIDFQGSALGAMVGQMTYGKRQWEEFDVEMRRLIPVVTSAADNMINMIDADTDAFNDYMVILYYITCTMCSFFKVAYATL